MRHSSIFCLKQLCLPRALVTSVAILVQQLQLTQLAALCAAMSNGSAPMTPGSAHSSLSSRYFALPQHSRTAAAAAPAHSSANYASVAAAPPAPGPCNPGGHAASSPSPLQDQRAPSAPLAAPAPAPPPPAPAPPPPRHNEELPKSTSHERSGALGRAAIVSMLDGTGREVHECLGAPWNDHVLAATQAGLSKACGSRPPSRNQVNAHYMAAVSHCAAAKPGFASLLEATSVPAKRQLPGQAHAAAPAQAPSGQALVQGPAFSGLKPAVRDLSFYMMTSSAYTHLLPSCVANCKLARVPYAYGTEQSYRKLTGRPRNRTLAGTPGSGCAAGRAPWGAQS